MAGRALHMLLVEDNPTDALLVREALTDVRSVPIYSNGPSISHRPSR